MKNFIDKFGKLILGIVIGLCIGFVASRLSLPSADTTNTKVTINESAFFSEEEVKEAMDLAKADFAENNSGVSLISLTNTEEDKAYYVNNPNEEPTLVILGDYRTGWFVEGMWPTEDQVHWSIQKDDNNQLGIVNYGRG